MAYVSPVVTTSGLTFAQFQSAGVSGLLEKLLTVNTTGTLDPTVAPTLSSVAGSNTLPTATYWVKVTETNGFGETLAIAAAASQAITLTAALRTTFATLKAGNTARNVYVSNVGASGPWTLVGTGVTASTFDVTAPLPADSRAGVTLPTVNSTGMTNAMAPRKIQFTRAAAKGDLQTAYGFLKDFVANFNSGKPIDIQEGRRKLKDFHVPLALLNQACVEIGTLMDANQGTVKPTATGAGVGTTARVWP